jgi:hypothetical protein
MFVFTACLAFAPTPENQCTTTLPGPGTDTIGCLFAAKGFGHSGTGDETSIDRRCLESAGFTRSRKNYYVNHRTSFVGLADTRQVLQRY